MSNSATTQFIDVLSSLKAGELGLLRSHAGQGLDQSVEGFDLFTGLWWPLRQKNPKTPRRSIAWLVAKLYAFKPIQKATDSPFARQMRRCEPKTDDTRRSYRQKFDLLLQTPLEDLEPALQWALIQIASNKNELKLDWVQLTDDLSLWDKGERISRDKIVMDVREQWARQYLDPTYIIQSNQEME